MYTYTQMLNKEASFDAFYRQFVTSDMLYVVEVYLGMDRLKRSTCPNFNDIPLKIWDTLGLEMRDIIAKDAATWRNYHHPKWSAENTKGFLFSKSYGVVLAKTAACMLLEQEEE